MEIPNLLKQSESPAVIPLRTTRRALNGIITLLVFLLFLVLFALLISRRLSSVEKVRCEVWQWQTCNQVFASGGRK